MKPGRETSEFLIGIATIVSATVLVGFGEITATMWQQIVLAIVGVYTGARTLLKAKQGNERAASSDWDQDRPDV